MHDLTLEFEGDTYPNIELMVPDAIVVRPRYNPEQDDCDLDNCLCDSLVLMARLQRSVTFKYNGYSYYLHYPGILEMVKDRCSARSH